MSDVLILDPADTQRLEEQDLIGQDYGAWPQPVGLKGTCVERNANGYPIAHEITQIEVNTDELARMLNGFRNAVLLPLSDEFNEQLRGWLAIYEDEAMRRIRGQQRRERSIARYGPSTWQDADLLAEVEAVCGAGVKRGREYRFPCPFHEDRSPSLRVDPVKWGGVWTCDPCSKSGGIVDWRKQIEGK